MTKTVKGTKIGGEKYDYTLSEEQKKALLSGKQDVISDLDTIRSGASAGATSLQSSDKGKANGVASLDGSGKVPSSQLPSYVDDVLEFESEEALPSEGESGKIYVTTNNNKTYRWSGSIYVEVGKSVAPITTDKIELVAAAALVDLDMRVKAIESFLML